MPLQFQPGSSVEHTCSDATTVSNSLPKTFGELSSGNPSSPEGQHSVKVETMTISDQTEKEDLPGQSSDTSIEITETKAVTFGAEEVPQHLI